ncbi:MAG: hypothetical protein J6W02_01365, partial [Bacteroidaceae bacterium]|nr:hypothetical protein [Bacteroidaceae bacterium]
MMKWILMFALALASENVLTQEAAQSGTPRRQRPAAYVIPTDAPILTKNSDGSYLVNTSGLCKD